MLSHDNSSIYDYFYSFYLLYKQCSQLLLFLSTLFVGRVPILNKRHSFCHFSDSWNHENIFHTLDFPVIFLYHYTSLYISNIFFLVESILLQYTILLPTYSSIHHSIHSSIHSFQKCVLGTCQIRTKIKHILCPCRTHMLVWERTHKQLELKILYNILKEIIEDS